jgi:hypothetical protein
VISMQMNIYLAPFHSSFGGYGENACGEAWGPLSRAVERGDWPYDIPGDDPAFFSRHEHGGNLTWGVCRQQVRNRLGTGDVVVFFSFGGSEDGGEIEYRLCAVATVEQKVRQTEIWSDRELRAYRCYLNLLVRPAKQKDGWEHYEPSTKDEGHEDWLWRVAEHRGLKKCDFERLERSDLLPADARVKGRPVRIAENYVIFSSKPTETVILAHPPVIARNLRREEKETWEQRGFSRTVKNLTLGIAHQYGVPRSRSLRSANLQHAHPPVHWRMQQDEGREWRRQFLRLIQNRRCLWVCTESNCSSLNLSPLVRKRE